MKKLVNVYSLPVGNFMQNFSQTDFWSEKKDMESLQYSNNFLSQARNLPILKLEIFNTLPCSSVQPLTYFFRLSGTHSMFKIYPQIFNDTHVMVLSGPVQKALLIIFK